LLENLNSAIFLLLNASAQPNTIILWGARVAAVWGIYAVSVLVVIGWIRGSSALRAALFAAGLTAVLALVSSFGITAVYDHPRPFAIGLGHQFLAHAPDGSFPSDHATILFAIAFALLLDQGVRFWSGVALITALIVAWSRVYLGIHWPLDMAGSALIAALSAALVHTSARTARQQVLSGVESLYEWGLDALRFPVWIFPRSKPDRRA